MKSLKNILFILALLILNSCTKDPEQPIEDDNVITETVSNFQLVSIDTGQEDFNQNEYTSEIGGIQINITKGSDNRLHFIIPGNLPEGNFNFQLKTIKRKYIVKKPVLAETPEKTIQPLRNQIDNILLTLENTSEAVIFTNNINSFNIAYTNLTAEQQNNLALFYKVNKKWFDFMMSNNYNENYTGRLTDIIKTELKKSMVGTSALVIGIVGVYFGTPEIKLLSVVPLSYGLYSVAKSLKKIYDEGFKTTSLIMDGEISEVTKKALAVISFQSETEKTLNFNTQDRKIILSDSANAKNELADFFDTYNKFNFCIDKANNIIVSLNTLPFVTLSLFTKFQLPADSPLVSNAMIPEIFNKIKFSITSSNLDLQSVGFTNGQLKMKIKNNSNKAVSDYLNYSFSDGFSTFSGRFPITVTLQNDIVGTWKAISSVLCGVDRFTIPVSAITTTPCGQGINGYILCSQDDLMIFNSDMTYEYNEGVISCNPPQEKINSTYSVNGNQIIVYGSGYGYATSTSEILELTSSTMKWKFTNGEIMTFQRQ
ncbi:hypothetical protein [Flavobacterium notoginsengisoli]|uniref:hypothetical protein n=1 Tax=Flavobacterium notoginsengisoli TaxID=1478199 RepID=UPI003635BC5C